jgi:hypothetical protein
MFLLFEREDAMEDREAPVNPEIFYMKVVCPKDNVELVEVQREHEGTHFCFLQCPVCKKLAPVCTVHSKPFENVPETGEIPNSALAKFYYAGICQ